MPVRRRRAAATRRRHPGWESVFRVVLKTALGATAVLLGVLTVAFIDANWRFAHQEASSPARIYTAPHVLTDGLAVVRSDLADRLKRLGYRQVDRPVEAPGEFRSRFRSFEIYLNSFDFADGPAPAMRVRLPLRFGRAGAFANLDTGERLESIRLEPESLGVLSGGVHEERLPVGLEEIPEYLSLAVIAVEDRRFNKHPGIDPRAVARAFFVNVKSGVVVQGGSTITQQLAKNLYPNSGERTIVRKIWETLAAFSLEAFHSKSEILELYLNQIYLAQRGPTSILGVGAASRHYIGRDVRTLDLAESALLAGLIQSPGRYHPFRHPNAALERRNLVLRLMRDEGFITDD